MAAWPSAICNVSVAPAGHETLDSALPAARLSPFRMTTAGIPPRCLSPCTGGWNGIATSMRSLPPCEVRIISPWAHPGLPRRFLLPGANLWKSTIFVTGFLRRAVTDAVGNFREDIGVGANTPYQSGEESDYFLRALALGFRMRYEPALTVHHPNLHSLERLRKKTYPYALGCGYVLRIHGYSWREFGALFARSVGGAVFSLCKGDISMAEIYWMRGAGQLRGYCLGPRDLARVAETRTH